MGWNIIYGIIAFIALAVVIVLLIPATRKGGASVEIHASAEHILNTLRDVENQPAWRKDIKSIEISDGGWTEVSSRNVRTKFHWVSVTPEKVELSYVSDAGFSGTWVANFTKSAAGTRMDVVEQVTIRNPFSRLISRIFFDPDAFSRSYLDQLKGKVES
jgi:hypothetical protein